MLDNKVILFVHGFDSSKSVWDSFLSNNRVKKKLKDYSFDFYEYPTNKIKLPFSDLQPKINDLARSLNTIIKVRHNDKNEIILIAHSMGGLICRKALIDNEIVGDARRVSKLILLATPNNGAEIAKYAKFLNILTKDMEPFSQFLEELNGNWSDIGIEKFVDTAYVVALQDKTVKSGSSKGDWGNKNVFFVADKDHSTITNFDKNNEDVLTLIFKIIRSEILVSNSVPDAESLVKTVHSTLNRIDNEILDLVGGGILSTRNDKEVVFKSEKILTSLTDMGLPFSIGIEVIENIVPYFEKTLKEKGDERIDTNDIRKITYSVIYALQPKGKKSGAVLSWANQYAQKYGDPNQRISYLKPIKKNSKPIDYHFLEKKIIPNSFFKITGKKIGKDPNLPNEIVKGSHVKHMARVLFDAIRKIPIYVYEIDTLEKIFINIATKIPHPWIASECFNLSLLNYDISRSRKWFKNFLEDFKTKNDDVAHHALIEFAHHTSSSILGFYGSYIGCLNFGAIDQLSMQMWKLIKNENVMYWHYCRINELWTDLSTCGVGANEFVRNIDRLRDLIKRFDNLNEDEKESLKESVRQFYAQTEKLLDYKTSMVI